MTLILGVGGTKPTYPYDHYYGIEITNWATSKSSVLTPINSDLMADSANPIWTRIRSFVENPDGSVKYYLDKNDSRFKEGGSARADLTGRDGNVMVEIPQYYMKQEWVNGAYRRLYSDYPLPGFFLVPRRVIAKFMCTVYTGTNDGALVQKGLVSNSLLQWSNLDYNTVTNGAESPVLRKAATASGGVGLLDFGSNEELAKLCRGGSSASSANDDAYNSMLGMCRTGYSRTNYRNFCANVNSAATTKGYVVTPENMLHIGAFHILNELAWLARVKTLDYDIQNVTRVPDFGGSMAKIGSAAWSTLNGYNPFIPNGITAPLGDRIGYVTYKYRTGDDETSFAECHAETVFGVELPIQYIWHITDDLLLYNNATNGESYAYYCDDASKFATPSDSTAESWAAEHGYKHIANVPFNYPNGSYIERESFAENGLSLPRDLGSGQVQDYYYSSGSAGWFGSLFGGYANRGAYAGFGSLHANVRPANAHAYIGARSCRY